MSVGTVPRWFGGVALTDRARALIAESRRRRALTPLAYASLWHQAAPRTSQREALAMLAEPGILVALLTGGNRTGKSELGAMYAVASAAGRDAVIVDGNGKRPVYWVRQFLARACLPAHLVRKQPSDVWVCSPTFAAARKQIRPKIRRWVPQGSSTVGWNSTSEAEIVIAGTGGKGIITSKAYRQFDADSQTWEGAAIGALILDEQPNSYNCLAAGLSRCVDFKARALMCVTPLRGKRDWLYQRFIRDPAPWMAHRSLHGVDNPHIDEATRQLMLASQPAWSRSSRDTGEFGDVEGRIYGFSRAAHVVPRWRPPPDAPRLVTIDWGSRAPHICWIAEDEAGRLICYRELAPRIDLKSPGMTARRLIMHAREIEAEAGEAGCDVYRTADSEDPGAIADAAELGWWIAPAKKGPGSVTRGIGMVDALLQTVDPLSGEIVAPRLVFTEDCPQTIAEMLDYRHRHDSTAEDIRPVKRDDHGPDAIRYAVILRAEYSGI